MSAIGKSAVMLMISTLFSKVLGFGRELALGSVYGANVYSDAYIVAMNIPATIFASIGTALATTFIPLYYENNSKGKEYALRYSNNIFNIVCILSIIISILGIIFAEPLVKIFAMGFEGESLNITIKFTKILMFSMMFIGCSSIMTSILQINENFFIPGLIGLPYNLIIILSIIVSIYTTPYILPIGGLIAVISQFIFQLPVAYKYGYRYYFIVDFKDENIKKIIRLVGPVFIGVAAYNLNIMIDRTLASTLGEGVISALNYASRLNVFAIGIFITTLSSVIYPKLSKVSYNRDSIEFIKMVRKSINIVILLIIPISIGAIVLSNPIVKILFQRGAFDESAKNMTSIALVFYSIGMIGNGLKDILSKVFYSLQDTKTPMINAAMSLLINIVLNIILIKYMNYAGLALATSASALICILLLFNSLKKKIGYFGQDHIIKTTIKSLIAAIIMGIVTYFTHNILSNTLGAGFIKEVLSLFGSVGIGVIVYGVLVIILKVEEVNIIINMIKSKISSRTKNIKSECI